MVVVVGRVVPYRIEHSRVHLALYGSEKLLIRLEVTLLLIVKTVESDILKRTRTRRCREGVSDRRLRRNLTPLGGDEAVRAVDRHSALIELLTVAEYILAHLAEINVEIAPVIGRRSLAGGIYERVEHPELDVLHVGCLEVVVVEFAHHTAPMLRRVVQCSVVSEVGAEVVRTALVRVICQIEDA